VAPDVLEPEGESFIEDLDFFFFFLSGVVGSVGNVSEESW
jgi:hypothetical protein